MDMSEAECLGLYGIVGTEANHGEIAPSSKGQFCQLLPYSDVSQGCQIFKEN